MPRSWSRSLVLGLPVIILQCAKNKFTSNIMLSFLKCDRNLLPSIPGLLPKYHPENNIPPSYLEGLFGNSLLFFSFFIMSVLRKSNTLSGLTPASPSHLIWLNCSGKCYSGLWVWPYLPILYNKHWIAFSYPFLSHSVSPLPFPVTEERQGNVHLLDLPHPLASFLINRHCFGHPLPLWSCDWNGVVLNYTFMLVPHLHFFYILGVIPTSLNDLLYFNLLNWILSPLFSIRLPLEAPQLHYL